MNLNAKLGPLPAKTWIIVVGGLGVGLYFYRRAQANNAVPATATIDTTAGITDQTPATDSASYYSPAGGGSGFDGGSNYVPPAPATPPPAPNPIPPTPTLARSTCATNLHRLNQQVHSLGATLSQLRAKHRQLTIQLRGTKDKATQASIHKEDVAVQKQAAAVTVQIARAEADYKAWQLRCIAVGVNA